MRHGRKSSARGVKDFKQHIAVSLDTQLIVGFTVTPFDQPESKPWRQSSSDYPLQTETSVRCASIMFIFPANQLRHYVRERADFLQTLGCAQ
jgi:hypothetical protein